LQILIGRKVAWSVGERKIRGKIVALHGRKGLVRARFRRGLSGYALGTHVEIIGQHTAGREGSA